LRATKSSSTRNNEKKKDSPQQRRNLAQISHFVLLCLRRISHLTATKRRAAQFACHQHQHRTRDDAHTTRREGERTRRSTTHTTTTQQSPHQVLGHGRQSVSEHRVQLVVEQLQAREPAAEHPVQAVRPQQAHHRPEAVLRRNVRQQEPRDEAHALDVPGIIIVSCRRRYVCVLHVSTGFWRAARAYVWVCVRACMLCLPPRVTCTCTISIASLLWVRAADMRL
jgi:hypothetical protein